MKCPFCKKTLEQPSIDCWLTCLNEKCTKSTDMWGSEELWQELIRTRKALDKAKWWLNEIVENHRYTPISTAEMALKEITALEQKDK
jgi:hypothetical protein